MLKFRFYTKIIVWSTSVIFLFFSSYSLNTYAQVEGEDASMRNAEAPMEPTVSEEAEGEVMGQEAIEEVAKEEELPKSIPDIIDSKETNEVNILRGELATVKVYSLTRLSITDPSIADVATVDADRMMIVGKAVGQTPFFIWDEYGKRTLMVRVYEEDLLYIKSRIEKLIKAAGIKGVTLEENVYEGKVMLMGQLTKEKLTELGNVIAPFSSYIVNLLKEETSEDLIQIDMQVAELSTTLQKSLGFDWTAGGASSPSLTYSETIPTADTQLERFIKIGDFTRTSALLLTVNNLLKQGKARVLSKPRLLVISGKEARFQVGGQYPIQTTTTSASGITAENITFKDYGIVMTITPTLRKGKVNIELSITISDIDASVTGTTAGTVAFTNRSAQTTLLLDDQQTIVLAGLIKSQRSTSVKKVPFFGDIPIVGFLFRTKSTPAADTDTEVVISLTPTIIPQIYKDKAEDESLAKKKEIEKSQEKIQLEGKKEETFEEEIAKATAMMEQQGLGEGTTESFVKDKPQEEEQDQMDRPSPQDEEIEEITSPPITPPTVPKAPAEITEETLEGVPITETLEEVQGAAIPPPELEDETMLSEAPAPDIVLEQEVAEVAGDISSITAMYVKSIQKKISEAITYPYEASEKGWSGTVKLTLRILKDGTLDEAYIKESSGYNIFDKDALDTAQILAPYAAFPPELDLKEIKVTIPIVYSQGSVALEVVCRPKIDQEEIKPFAFSGKTYSEIIQERIARSIFYPEQAKPYGWEGTVKLNLQIMRDGTLAQARIKESSGNKMFDECALQTAKALAPYSDFPPESQPQDLNLTIPIIYSLDK